MNGKTIDGFHGTAEDGSDVVITLTTYDDDTTDVCVQTTYTNRDYLAARDVFLMTVRQYASVTPMHRLGADELARIDVTT
jgi:hypothetical protein